MFFEKLAEVAREAPAGSKIVYSDIGVLRFQAQMESQFGDWNDWVSGSVWSQMEGSKLHYRPVIRSAAGERFAIQASGESVAMTEVCPWRGLLQGQVHDDNAWSLGGVAAHAGVFGRLNDVVQWVQTLFDQTWVSLKTLQRFTQIIEPVPGVRRSIGFDRPSLDGSGSTGFSFGPNTIGHLGYTGTSLWIDLDTGFFAVLLTNRVHPTRTDDRIRSLRKAFHGLITKV
jgi:CubicO group peptidase (beta-lactamase class C family)